MSIVFKAEFQGDTFTIEKRESGMYLFKQVSESGEMVNICQYELLEPALKDAMNNMVSWAVDIDNGLTS